MELPTKQRNTTVTDQTNTTETETPFVRLNLCCPYCSGELYIITDNVSSGYYSDTAVESIECNGLNWCHAVFEPNGELRYEPKYIRWPEEYPNGKEN